MIGIHIMALSEELFDLTLRNFCSPSNDIFNPFLIAKEPFELFLNIFYLQLIFGRTETHPVKHKGSVWTSISLYPSQKDNIPDGINISDIVGGQFKRHTF